MRAAAARMQGRFDEARELYLESQDLCRQLGNEAGVAGENHNLTHVALHAGDLDEARRRYEAFRDWTFAHDNAYLLPYALLDSGVLALHSRNPGLGATLMGAAQRAFRDSASIPDPDDALEVEHASMRLRHELGAKFEENSAEGENLSPGEARSLALSV